MPLAKPRARESELFDRERATPMELAREKFARKHGTDLAMQVRENPVEMGDPSGVGSGVAKAVTLAFPRKVFRGVHQLLDGTVPTLAKKGKPTFFSADEAYASTYGRSATGGQHMVEAVVEPKKIFDYENLDHYNQILEAAKNSPKHLAKIKERANNSLARGEWFALEDKKVLAAIRKAKFDSFYTHEGGVDNIGIIKPKEVIKELAVRKRY